MNIIRLPEYTLDRAKQALKERLDTFAMRNALLFSQPSAQVLAFDITEDDLPNLKDWLEHAVGDVFFYTHVLHTADNPALIDGDVVELDNALLGEYTFKANRFRELLDADASVPFEISSSLFPALIALRTSLFEERVVAFTVFDGFDSSHYVTTEQSVANILYQALLARQSRTDITITLHFTTTSGLEVAQEATANHIQYYRFDALH